MSELQQSLVEQLLSDPDSMPQVVAKVLDIQSAQIQTLEDNVVTAQELQDAVDDYQPLADKGLAGGYAGLDMSGKIPVEYLPNSVMEYKGLYDAANNIPALSDGSGNAGDVYEVSVPGSHDFGSGSISLIVGDFIVYGSGTWKKSAAGGAVVGANLTLSNLSSPTAINQDLLPSGSKNLGSPSAKWVAGHFSSQVYVGGSVLLTGTSVIATLVDAGTYSFGGSSPGYMVSASTMPSGVLSGITMYKLQNPTRPNLAIYTSSNAVADAIATDNIRLETGNKTGGTGNSGAIHLQTGTSVGGTRGAVVLSGSVIDASNTKIVNVATPTAATDVATKGYVDSASGANTTLSNLVSPTSVNQDLIPLGSSTKDLGSFLTYWRYLYTTHIQMNTRIIFTDTSNLKMAHSMTLPSGTVAGGIGQENNAANQPIAVYTAVNGSNNANPTMPVRIETGNKTGGTGDSGAIHLQTGTSVGGSRGKVMVNAAALNLNTTAAPLTPANGDIYFDGTNMKMYVAGVWKTFTLV